MGIDCQSYTAASNGSDNLLLLRNFPKPCPTFLKTKMCNVVKNKLLTVGGTKMLHIYGMSGGGKSQLVSIVCEELKQDRSDILIWHVQCQQSDNVVIPSWRNLMQKLLAYLPREISVAEKTDICHELNKGWIKHFVHKLNSIRNPILLVVEDVATEEERKLFRDVITEIQSPDITNLQVLVVTQRKEALFISEYCQNFREYDTIEIAGFETGEAVEFLGKNDLDSQRLAEELAYSPLRLFLVKVYCNRHIISFKHYYDNLGKDESIIAKEKEILANHPEIGKHTYEIVINVLNRTIQSLEFQVVKMTSFVSNFDIPDVLLGAFFSEIEQVKTVTEERRHVSHLLKTLEDAIHLTIWNPLDQEDKYGQTLASMHNDILSAVRFSMTLEERREVLLKVMRCVTGLVGKENRHRSSNQLLCTMKSHLHKVVDHATELLGRDFHLEVNLCLGRLFEVLGFAETQTSGQTNDLYFDKAMNCLWKVARHYSGRNTSHSNVLPDELCYKATKSPVEVSELYSVLQRANAQMPPEVIMETCHRFFPLTEPLLEDISTSKLHGKEVNFDQMKDLLKERRLTQKDMEGLRSLGAVLNSEQLKRVFLTEWMVSILYSRARQFFYLKDSNSAEELKHYERYGDVGLELCNNMSRDTGIRSIFSFIIRLNVNVPRLLHQIRECETAEAIWICIEKCRKMALDLLKENDDFYEHGIYKRVTGTPYTTMIIYKYLVKANTKLHKQPRLPEQHPIANAGDECKELHRIARQLSSKFVIASNCMIHVGKYYAAIGEYDEAMKAFEDGFKFEESGINSVLDRKPNTFTWALYNYGRALLASQGDVENFSIYAKKFQQRYDIVSRLMSKHWREQLDKIKLQLESLTSASK